MNKILEVIKYILYVISIVFFSMFICKYGLDEKSGISVIITVILLIVTLRINIGSLFMKNGFRKTAGYSIMTIIPLLTLIITSFRSLYDKAIVINANIENSLSATSSFNADVYMSFYLKVVIVLFILNIVYLIYNTKKSTK